MFRAHRDDCRRGRSTSSSMTMPAQMMARVPIVVGHRRTEPRSAARSGTSRRRRLLPGHARGPEMPLWRAARRRTPSPACGRGLRICSVESSRVAVCRDVPIACDRRAGGGDVPVVAGIGTVRRRRDRSTVRNLSTARADAGNDGPRARFDALHVAVFDAANRHCHVNRVWPAGWRQTRLAA